MIKYPFYQAQNPVEPLELKIPEMPDVYCKKAIELGLGIPPVKPLYQSSTDYGAKCMVEGYEKGYKDAKKKFKKKIKKMKKELKEANREYAINAIQKAVETGNIAQHE